MKKNFKSTNELLGCYISNRWNGSSSIWKVTKATPKTVELTEVEWHYDEEDPSDDPTWINARINFDENGNPIFKHVMNSVALGHPEIRKVVKHVKFDKDGYILQIPDIVWSGAGSMNVVALNDEEAKSYKFSQYWG